MDMQTKWDKRHRQVKDKRSMVSKLTDFNNDDEMLTYLMDKLLSIINNSDNDLLRTKAIKQLQDISGLGDKQEQDVDILTLIPDLEDLEYNEVANKLTILRASGKIKSKQMNDILVVLKMKQEQYLFDEAMKRLETLEKQMHYTPKAKPLEVVFENE